MTFCLFSYLALTKYTLLKNVGLLFLGILLFLQAGGLLLYFDLQRIHAFTSMHQHVGEPDDKTTILRLSAREYAAAKEGGDELRIDGEMYDVKSIANDGEFVVLSVIHDEEEGHYLKKIEQTLKLGTGGDKDAPVTMIKLLTFEYLLPSRCLFRYSLSEECTDFPSFEQSLLSEIGGVFAPPPDMVL